MITGWGRCLRPVINVSWDDAQEYVRWLSRTTGAEYRLLSEAEWEYVARAGTTTPYHTGETITTDEANFQGDTYRGQTIPVGSFTPNAFGLYDVHGNVWEWVEDCWNYGYEGAPSDGSAWESGDCDRWVLRGGSWIFNARYLRSAFRDGYSSWYRDIIDGFRVARTLNS